MVKNQLTIFDIVPARELESEPKLPDCQYHNNTEPTVNSYSPGHPWYYKLGGRVLDPEEIEGVNFSQRSFQPVHRRNLKPSSSLTQQLAAAEKELAKYIDQYNRLVKVGDAACSKYDLMMGYDAKFNLALKYSQIAYNKGLFEHLEVLVASSIIFTHKLKAMKKDEYPLLHIYALWSDRPIQIIGNTEGLLTLAVAIIEATSIQGIGRAEVFYADASAYEIEILRDDSESAWEIKELPYKEQKQ